MRLLAKLLSFCCFFRMAASIGRKGPCDIFATAGTPCVAAYATTRSLFASYSGPLYEVTRSSDKTSRSIGVLSAGGVADAAAQDAFCASSESCVVTRIFDQSSKGNDLATAPGGPWYSPWPDRGCNATARPTTLAGHKVYGLKFEGKMGYRNDTTSGVATGDASETIYMVVDGQHYNNRCCMDFGNAETNVRDDGKGTMEAVYYGSSSGGLFPVHKSTGDGPWVMAGALRSNAAVCFGWHSFGHSLMHHLRVRFRLADPWACLLAYLLSSSSLSPASVLLWCAAQTWRMGSGVGTRQ